MSELDVQSGQLLPGTKYRVVRRLGEGAMGVVYECVKEPGIRCVVKIMRRYLTEDVAQRQRFLVEVRLLAELEHPNIVKVFDYDLLADGTPFFAMELLSGKTLQKVLNEQGTVPPRVAYKVMRQLLAALQCAHTHSTPIVHRDIKPDNIFLHSPRNGESTVKLLDFGVATFALRSTLVAGTYGYMSPEQLRSEPLTAKTDVYAAAVVLFEMLAGQGPFEAFAMGGREALGRATLSAPAPRLSRYVKALPESVDDAVAAALEKDPEKRPSSAAEFLDLLAELDREDLVLAPLSAPVASDLRTSASLTAVVNAGEAPLPLGVPVPHAPPLTFTTPQSEARRERERVSARRRGILAVAAGVATTILIATGAVALSKTKGPRAMPSVQPPPVAAAAPVESRSSEVAGTAPADIPPAVSPARTAALTVPRRPTSSIDPRPKPSAMASSAASSATARPANTSFHPPIGD